jgi:hypothetical protein
MTNEEAETYCVIIQYHVARYPSKEHEPKILTMAAWRADVRR